VNEVLDYYVAAILEGRVVIAHNAQWDTKAVRSALRRNGRDDLFEETPNICTMRACTDICRLPKAKGGGFKFPKLAEACAHFQIVQDGAHAAMPDAMAAYRIFRKLMEIGKCPEPMVYFAKESA
jgi:DNA polymerase III epsilon subunit-like protein